MRTTKEVHISAVRKGDIVLHNGVEKTVGTDDIKHSAFMGTSLFGDSYRLGTKPVILVKYPTEQ